MLQRILVIVVLVLVFSCPVHSADDSPPVGRPVRVVSLSFAGLAADAVFKLVETEAGKGCDLLALPEMWPGNKPETLDGPTLKRMGELARKYNTYIVCPIYRSDGPAVYNSAVLLDREGKVVCVYDKMYPYWEEWNTHANLRPGREAVVYEADFGKIGFAICFDANFPEVWKQLADKGAELVIWPSAYSAGTTLQAHALVNHFYIVTSTWTRDCIVYDITGEEIAYEKKEPVNVTRVVLDLDRGIYHENYNWDKKEKLLRERPDDIAQEKYLTREQWFVLKAKHPGVSARGLAREYGLEELRDYVNRSRTEIDRRREAEGGAKP